MTEEDGFFALKLMPARASRAAMKRPDWPFIRLESALRLRPRRALSSAQARPLSMAPSIASNQEPTRPLIIPVLLAQCFPVLLAPRQRLVFPLRAARVSARSAPWQKNREKFRIFCAQWPQKAVRQAVSSLLKTPTKFEHLFDSSV